MKKGHSPDESSLIKSHAHSATSKAARHLLAGCLQMRRIEAPTQADIDLLFLVVNQAEIVRLLLEQRGGGES
jgi:hypothetical protein